MQLTWVAKAQWQDADRGIEEFFCVTARLLFAA
jgi:hypothetical protein